MFYRFGVSSVYVTEENIAPVWKGYVMKTPLKEIITLKASQLHESGILTNLLSTTSLEDFKSKLEKIGPQVLTLQHLSAGFVVIFSLLAFSVAVFAVEVAPKLWKIMQAWLGKAVFCYILVKFTRMNKLK
jgi:hypothetical protein